MFAFRLLLVVILITHFSPTIFSQSLNRLIQRETSIYVERNGVIFEEESFLILVGSKDSEWITDIEIPYQQGNKVDVVEATILNKELQVVRKLKKKEITSKNYFSNTAFYEDTWLKCFTLKWHQYPYFIRYKTRKSYSEYLFVADWTPYIHDQVAVESASLTVSVPHDFDVFIKEDSIFNVKKTHVENRTEYQWTGKKLMHLPDERFMPPLKERLPRVQIIPQQFTYGIRGQHGSWAQFGQWQAAINEGLEYLQTSEQRKVDQIISGLDSKAEKVRALYYYLQDNTRYINVSIDIGGLKPYPASYVATNKYGDCKALTMYMKALLHYAGIPSYYVKIFAGKNPVIIDESFPSQQFNHVILCVPLEEDTVWLENTSDVLPYNYLGIFTQNRRALLIDGSDSKLVKTPALTDEEVLEANCYVFSINNTEKGTLKWIKTAGGERFEHLRYLLQYLDEKEQQAYFEELKPRKSSQLQTWSFAASKRDTAFETVEMEWEVEDMLGDLGSNKYITLPNLPLPKLERCSERRLPLRINVPIHRIDTVIYSMEKIDEYTVQLPQNHDVQTAFGSFQQYFFQENNNMCIVRKLFVKRGFYPLEQYPAFFEFIKTIETYTEQSVIILASN